MLGMLLYRALTACQISCLAVWAADIQSNNLVGNVLNLEKINEKSGIINRIGRKKRGVYLDDPLQADENQRQLDLPKSMNKFRNKRSLAAKQRHRGKVNRLSEILLGRQKRHLSERERSLIDPYGFPAKDYNYYDYNNMLTAITLPSSTLKFVERVKKENPEVAQANDVIMFNRKHKNVWGGFHNDSEMLHFLRKYKNYTMEEKKHLFWNELMIDRCNKQVEIWEQNYHNYKKHYRSFREKSNKEGHNYVNPDTEDQSAIIPDFEEPEILNYTMLYKLFRLACEKLEEKESEPDPPPVNHYMPANYTSSDEPDEVYRSGLMEAFQSDYNNERINTSCWKHMPSTYPVCMERRKRRSNPQVKREIAIKVIDRIYQENNESPERPSYREICDCKKTKKGKRNENNEDHIRKEEDHENRDFEQPFEHKKKPNPIQNVNQINIMFQINQNGVQNEEPKNHVKGRENLNQLNALSDILNSLKRNVNLNGMTDTLDNIAHRNSEGTICLENTFNVVRNILTNLVQNNQDDSKSLKEFAIFEDNLPKIKAHSRSKRSLSERKFLTISKAVRTVDSKDEFVLHLFLVPSSEAEAFETAHQAHARRKRDVHNEDDPLDHCPIMKTVFSWKDNESKLKRKKRENSEEIKGYQDPAEEKHQGCPITRRAKTSEEEFQGCPITRKTAEPSEEEPRGCPLTRKTVEPYKEEKEEPQGCPITRKTSEAPEEEFRGCPITRKTAEPSEEEFRGCPITRKTAEPSEEEFRGCPITRKTGESSNEEPQGCPITRKTVEPSKEEESRGCPITRRPAVEEPLDLSLDHVKAQQENPGAPLNSALVQKSFKKEAAEEELQQPWAGFSEYVEVSRRVWTTVANPVKPITVSFNRYGRHRQRGGPYVVSRKYSLVSRSRVTYEVNPVSKVVEPKFVRIIYNGKGYVRHVHYITNREFQNKKFMKEDNQLKNIYRENFQMERNETVKQLARAQHKIPRLIQNHFADGKSNVTRYINLYYDVEGDLIYTTNDQNFRIPIAKQWLPNKYYYRNYYHRTFNKRILTSMKEPVVVQLHYRY